MINAAVFLVYEELLPRYEWKTNHSSLAVVNTLRNLHVCLVTAARITESVRLSLSVAAVELWSITKSPVSPQDIFLFI